VWIALLSRIHLPGTWVNKGMKRGHQGPASWPSSTFRNYIYSEPRFRTLLAEGASEVELALV
jgi:hypothetical protein